MDILIKNIEMPRSCEDCFACEEYSSESFDYCKILKAMTTRGGRRKDCPIVELPKHGRLGDLDEISNKLLGKGLTRFFVREKRYLTIGDARKIIENAPVIVEATE